MTNHSFHFSQAELIGLAQQLIAKALKDGATACEAEISEGNGWTVSVRLGSIETLEYHQDKSITVSVYIDKKRGQASSSDFTPQALDRTVQAALDIARLTASDVFSGLAEPTMLCQSIMDLDLYYPWSMTIDEAITLAKRCEQSGRDVSNLIVNSDGATVTTQTQQFIYANSLEFCAGYPTSQHRIAASFVAEQYGMMQSDHWMSVACDAHELMAADRVGYAAAHRTIKRLGAKQIKTGRYPVLFDSPVASSLIAHLIEGLSGDKLYRRSSFLLDSLGKVLLPTWINLVEDPFIPRGLGSCPFDAEGVAVKRRFLIEKGCIAGYLLDSYAARRLNMISTGNAGGAHNLILQHSHATQSDLLKVMGHGILVTELMGDGVNIVTGDYSQGAAGFWIENGHIAYPIEEITIAGNLKEMLGHIVAVANDAVVWGAKRVGSILIESMTIAGKN